MPLVDTSIVSTPDRTASPGHSNPGRRPSAEGYEAPLPSTDEFEADPSHSEITGVPLRDSDEAIVIGDVIAECVMYPLYPGKVD